MKELTSVIFQTSSRVCKVTARSTGGGKKSITDRGAKKSANYVSSPLCNLKLKSYIFKYQ